MKVIKSPDIKIVGNNVSVLLKTLKSTDMSGKSFSSPVIFFIYVDKGRFMGLK